MVHPYCTSLSVKNQLQLDCIIGTLMEIENVCHVPQTATIVHRYCTILSVNNQVQLDYVIGTLKASLLNWTQPAAWIHQCCIIEDRILLPKVGGLWSISRQIGSLNSCITKKDAAGIRCCWGLDLSFGLHCFWRCGV